MAARRRTRLTKSGHRRGWRPRFAETRSTSPVGTNMRQRITLPDVAPPLRTKRDAEARNERLVLLRDTVTDRRAGRLYPALREHRPPTEHVVTHRRAHIDGETGASVVVAGIAVYDGRKSSEPHRALEVE